MTLLGWLFLILSLGSVLGLAAWCYYRVLTSARKITKPPDMLGG